MPPLWPGFSTIFVPSADRADGDTEAATGSAVGIALGVDFATVVTRAAVVAVEMGLGGAAAVAAVIVTSAVLSATTRARPGQLNEVAPPASDPRAGYMSAIPALSPCSSADCDMISRLVQHPWPGRFC